MRSFDIVKDIEGLAEVHSLTPDERFAAFNPYLKKNIEASKALIYG